MKLSVVIVNYNVKYFLEQCLHSVLAATQQIDAEVYPFAQIWTTKNVAWQTYKDILAAGDAET